MDEFCLARNVVTFILIFLETGTAPGQVTAWPTSAIIYNIGALFGEFDLSGFLSDALGAVAAWSLAFLFAPLPRFRFGAHFRRQHRYAGPGRVFHAIHGARKVGASFPAHITELSPDTVRGFLPGSLPTNAACFAANAAISRRNCQSTSRARARWRCRRSWRSLWGPSSLFLARKSGGLATSTFNLCCHATRSGRQWGLRRRSRAPADSRSIIV